VVQAARAFAFELLKKDIKSREQVPAEQKSIQQASHGVQQQPRTPMRRLELLLEHGLAP